MNEEIYTIFDETKRQFEVYKHYNSTTTSPAFEALLLTLTMDEVCELLQEQAITMLGVMER
jgi:uncharacterized membrane protein YukC